MKNIKSKLAAVAVAASLMLGASVVAAPAATAAPVTCDQVVKRYESLRYTVQQLHTNAAVCKLGNAEIHLSGNWTKAVQLLQKGKSADAKAIVARDWAAVIARTPTKYRSGLLKYAEAKVASLTTKSVRDNYVLMLNHEAFEQRTWFRIGNLYDALKVAKKVVKKTKVKGIVKPFLDTVLASEGYVRGTANDRNATILVSHMNFWL